MNFLHSQLNFEEGQVVHVTLSGNAANVVLLDDAAFERYKKGEPYTHASGGYYTRSPVVLRPPKPGQWHLVVDLGGQPGQVNASVSIRPG